VVTVAVAAVVDVAVGGLDHPAARLHDEALPGFWPGDDLDTNPALAGGRGDGGAGIARVQPHAADSRRDPFSFAEQVCKGRPVLNVSGRDNGCHQDGGTAEEHMAFGLVDFLGAVESARTGHR
jgi:hypothetical protein